MFFLRNSFSQNETWSILQHMTPATLWKWNTPGDVFFLHRGASGLRFRICAVHQQLTERSMRNVNRFSVPFFLPSPPPYLVCFYTSPNFVSIFPYVPPLLEKLSSQYSHSNVTKRIEYTRSVLFPINITSIATETSAGYEAKYKPQSAFVCIYNFNNIITYYLRFLLSQ
jgi:hypothetical protein